MAIQLRKSKRSAAPAVTSLFAEQSLALQRCSEDFRVLAQQATDNATENELSERREVQRAAIERLASNQFRGPDWPNAMVTFVCSVLKKIQEIAKLKQDNAIRAVVGPSIGFHARAWAIIRKRSLNSGKLKERRVDGEMVAENARVALSKVRALFMLTTAGGALLFFMAMALYLIFAKIEDNLASIHRAIVKAAMPGASVD